MFLKISLLLLFVAYTSAEFVQLHNCPEIVANSKDVTIEVTDCASADERCPLYRGKSHSVIIHFTPTKNYTGKMDFRVYGVFERLTVPYRGRTDAFLNAVYVDSNESLKDLGIFLSDRHVKHSSDFAVSSTYPKVELKVRFAMIEKRTKEYMFCQEIKVGIKDLPTETNES